MTQLPFEDLPEKPAKLVLPHIAFAEFWIRYPRKVGKRTAEKAYRKALVRVGTPEAHDTILDGLARYRTNKPTYCDWMHPTTFLNGDHWEDEYDTPRKTTLTFWTDEELSIIAAHVKADWYERGKYPRDVLQQCVDAGLLTVERMEDVT